MKKQFSKVEQIFGVLKEETCAECTVPHSCGCLEFKRCYRQFQSQAEEIYWKFVRPLEQRIETADRKVARYEQERVNANNVDTGKRSIAESRSA